MPIVQSANPSPSKINASLNTSEEVLAKPSEEIIAILDFIVSDTFVNGPRTTSSEEISDSLFYYKRGKPTISLNDYMKRIRHFTECSNEILVISLIYLERILEKHHFNKEKMNFHKLIFLALLAAIKYQEDDIHTNTYYARVGGVKGDDLFNLELEFLELIEFNLFVDEKLFGKTLEKIQLAFQKKCEEDELIKI